MKITNLSLRISCRNKTPPPPEAGRLTYPFPPEADKLKGEGDRVWIDQDFNCCLSFSITIKYRLKYFIASYDLSWTGQNQKTWNWLFSEVRIQKSEEISFRILTSNFYFNIFKIFYQLLLVLYRWGTKYWKWPYGCHKNLIYKKLPNTLNSLTPAP